MNPVSMRAAKGGRRREVYYRVSVIALYEPYFCEGMLVHEERVIKSRG